MNRILRPEPDGEARIEYKSKILAIQKQPMRIGEKRVEFEKAIRSPGVRAIIDDGARILLSKEYREELNGYDYRLAGGKVFDTLEEYLENRGSNVSKQAKQAVKEECLEELGITVHEAKYLASTSPGATVEWILHYFVITRYDGNPSEQQTKEGEHTMPEWVSYEQVREWCLNGTIQEETSALYLLRYLQE